MEEEVNQRVVSVSFSTGKMTAGVVARAMAGFIAAEHQRLNQHAAERSSQPKHGKVKFEQLMDMDAGADRMELEKRGLKTFDRVARKYHIDYAIKKDSNEDPPRYYLFFKTRDRDAMKLALKEYGDAIRKQEKKESMKEKIRRNKEKSKELDKKRAKDKNRSKERSL